ncbi:hypothetical protein [Leisingera sp. JC1]|jgi:hypothetical protein|uniref:hypothetical protein n=1 Tax=Leisingera sp. JC1 TaxID=1855282 RepID=UPI000802E340|nr:hypothetical protein [Leisingera sp. JC1]OBY26793.1 hypothetical protein A9D60_17535 [Leisingera sp. JC1]
MKDGIKEVIEAMGVRFGEPLRGYEKASQTLETCEGQASPEQAIERSARVQAIPVAQVEDTRGKTGVAYFWNTGELQVSWQ